MENKKYISTTEVASLLGISRIAVYQKVKQGKIKSVRVGKNYAIPYSEVVRLTGEVETISVNSSQKNMETVILLFECTDQKGIVRKVSDFIFQHEGNIITADQYSTDPENGHFFLRVEFYIDENFFPREILERDIDVIAEEFDAQWKLYYKKHIPHMGILVSKPDHCLVDLLYQWKSGEIKVNIPFVISNHMDHKQIVESYGIPYHYIPSSKEDRKEKEILEIAKMNSDFLVFARYMVVVSNEFLSSYGKDIINIHHSFLPSFKGANPYRQAFEKGVKVVGATSHFVTSDLDEGPIISQFVESVSHRDGAEDLKRKGKNMEKRALSQAVYNYIDRRIIKYKNRTIVF